MSIRIFGSGGGVITDATATPEDVVSGQIFYNNDGRQVGTSTNRRIKEQIYVCEKGIHSSYSFYGAVNIIAESSVNSGTRSNPLRCYITLWKTTSSSTIKPPSSGNTSGFNMFYAIENLNIPVTSIDYITAGKRKFIIGSDSLYGKLLYRYSIGTVQWVRNNEPITDRDELIYPVMEFKLTNDVYYLTFFGLVNSETNWGSSYSTSVYSDNIPIKIVPMQTNHLVHSYKKISYSNRKGEYHGRIKRCSWL